MIVLLRPTRFGGGKDPRACRPNRTRRGYKARVDSPATTMPSWDRFRDQRDLRFPGAKSSPQLKPMGRRKTGGARGWGGSRGLGTLFLIELANFQKNRGDNVLVEASLTGRRHSDVFPL